jgi:predicted permease
VIWTAVLEDTASQIVLELSSRMRAAYQTYLNKPFTLLWREKSVVLFFISPVELNLPARPEHT